MNKFKPTTKPNLYPVESIVYWCFTLNTLKNQDVYSKKSQGPLESYSLYELKSKSYPLPTHTIPCLWPVPVSIIDTKS